MGPSSPKIRGKTDQMRLCTTHPVVRRTWTVELRPERGGPVLHCRQCPPGSPSVRAAARQALAHLARHARRDALPSHLRTCQCHPHGCRWHPRHRGCAGPVLLVLTREQGGRLWRLADVCAACAAATTHAAVVPESVLCTSATAHAPTSGHTQATREPHGPSEQVRVREMLSYLASALPQQASPSARLLAVQCALRSTSAGRVHLPPGLLRGMRTDLHTTARAELEGAAWLHCIDVGPHHTSTGIMGYLTDSALLTQAPGRSSRCRAADWALRVCHSLKLRNTTPASRLLTLALVAHLSANCMQALADEDVISRSTALTPEQLHHELDLLVDSQVLQHWSHDRSGDLLWTIAPNNAWQKSQGVRPRSSISSEPTTALQELTPADLVSRPDHPKPTSLRLVGSG